MNLQEMIQKYNDDTIVFDSKKIKMADLLRDSKYSILLDFLNKKEIIFTNDLKKLTQQEFDRIKIDLPNQPGVGGIKTDLYIKKLDEIRKEINDIHLKNENRNINDKCESCRKYREKHLNIDKKFLSVRVSKEEGLEIKEFMKTQNMTIKDIIERGTEIMWEEMN